MARKFVSFEILKLILDIELPHIERHILIEVCSHMDDQGKYNSFLGIKKISKNTNLSERTVIKYLASLVKKQLLVKHPRVSGSPYPAQYDLNITFILGTQKDKNTTQESDNPAPSDAPLYKKIAVNGVHQTDASRSLDWCTPCTTLVHAVHDIKNVYLLKNVNVTRTHALIVKSEQRQNEEMNQEDNMQAEQHDRWMKTLKSLGLTESQCKEFIGIELTKGGYLISNLKWYETRLEAMKPDNPIAFLVDALRNNYGKWGEAPVYEAVHGEPMQQMTNKERGEAYWARCEQATPEQRERWYQMAEGPNKYLGDLLGCYRLTKEDFVRFQPKDEQKWHLKSMLIMIMESVEHQERLWERMRNRPANEPMRRTSNFNRPETIGRLLTQSASEEK